MQIHIISMEPTEKNKLSNQEFPSLPFCLCVSVNGVCAGVSLWRGVLFPHFTTSIFNLPDKNVLI